MTAVEHVLAGTGPRMDLDLLGMAKRMQDGLARYLGRRQLDGRTAQGFHRPDKLNDVTVWVDDETRLPVRIELVQETIGRKIIYRDFEFNVDFDESLFRTTAPDGYALE